MLGNFLYCKKRKYTLLHEMFRKRNMAMLYTIIVKIIFLSAKHYRTFNENSFITQMSRKDRI